LRFVLERWNVLEKKVEYLCSSVT